MGDGGETARRGTGPFAQGEVSLSRGALCVSIDLELGWGTWDHLTERYLRLCTIHERPVVRRLLEILDEHEAPVTWAAVSRLLDEGDASARRGGLQNWYAPELVDWIRRAGTPHEIGSHGYAHVYYPQIPRSEVARDVAMAASVHRREGLPFRSFVFPRNLVAYTDVLEEHGVRVFRSVDAGVLHDIGRSVPVLRPVTNFADKILPWAPRVVRPRRVTPGLIELETSLLLIARNGLRRVVSPQRLAQKLSAGLRAAAARRSVFHLWFHPSNFYFDSDKQYALLGGLLREAAILRARGEIDIRTMGSFADAG